MGVSLAIFRLLGLGALLFLVGCAQAAPASSPGRGEGAKPRAEPPARDAGAPSGPLPTVKVSYGSPIGAFAPLYMAEESGAFKKYGVSAEVQYIQANLSVAAMIAKESDFIVQSAPAMLSANLNSGADLVMVAGTLNRFIFSVFGAKDVRSPLDLKGKLWATDRPGTTNDYAMKVALKRMGIGLDEVQALPVGSSDKILPALLSGEVTGTALTPPASFQAEREGFPRLMDLFDVPYQNVGIIVLGSRMGELEPVMVPLLKAIREGIQRYNSDKPFALSVLAKWTRESDPEVLDKTYEFFRRQAPFNVSLSISEPGIQAMLEFFGETIPAAKTARPSDFFDSRFVDKLGPP